MLKRDRYGTYLSVNFVAGVPDVVGRFLGFDLRIATWQPTNYPEDLFVFLLSPSLWLLREVWITRALKSLESFTRRLLV